MKPMRGWICRLAAVAILMLPALASGQDEDALAASNEPANGRGTGWFGRGRTPEEQARLDAEREQRRAELHSLEQKHLERLVLLEEKESGLARRREQRPTFHLRELINAIDHDSVESQARADEELVLQAKLREKRDRDRKHLENWKRDGKASLESMVELGGQIELAGERIVLHSLEASRWETLATLAAEASRIAESIEALPVNPRPTVRMIIEKRRNLQVEQKRLLDSEAAIQSLKEVQAELEPALEVLRSRAAEFDERIRVLEEKADLTRERADREAVGVEKTRRRLVDERIEVLDAQQESIRNTMTIEARQGELYRAELQVLQQDLDALVERYRRSVMLPLGVIGVLAAIFLIISRLILPRFYKRDRLFIARRIGRYLTLLLVFIILLAFFFEDLRPFATALGIAGAALVIALQDLCSAFAGWFVIVASRKVRVGDRIEVDGQRGDVLDIQLLRTTLVEVGNWLQEDEPTGRIIIIPNSYIFKGALINFTHVHPYIWDRIEITLTHETPWREAEALLRRILGDETREEFASARAGGGLMASLYGTEDSSYEPRVNSVLVDNGLKFRLLFVSHYRHVASTRNRINSRILAEFEKDKRMQLAYPTQREISG